MAESKQAEDIPLLEKLQSLWKRLYAGEETKEILLDLLELEIQRETKR